MKFSVYQASRTGGRHYNQDRVAYAYSNETLLLVLADGMGGHLHGEVAAQIAIRTFMQSFQQAALSHIANPEEFLEETMRCSHDAIIRYAHSERLGGSPGTTCVAALVQDGKACWAHAGDSRFYLLRNHEMVAITRDHSVVQQWMDWGIISEEEMKTHPDRNRITNCLGGVEDMFYVEPSPIVPLQQGDVLLLCSDGLWGPLEETDLVAGFSGAPLSLATEQLMDKAITLGGEHADNTTVVAARWGDSEAEQAASQPVCKMLEIS